MASSILSPNSPILPNTAAAIACFPALAGVAILFRPTIALAILDVPNPPTAKEQKLAHNLIKIVGARDVYLGLSVLTAWYLEDRKMLGWLMVFGGGAVVVDGVAQKGLTGGGVWKHSSLVLFMAGVGGALLGWLDPLVS